MEAEMGEMWPKPRNMEPPKAGDKEGSPLKASEGARLCAYLDFRLLVFGTIREHISVV